MTEQFDSIVEGSGTLGAGLCQVARPILVFVDRIRKTVSSTRRQEQDNGHQMNDIICVTHTKFDQYKKVHFRLNKE